MEGAELLEKGGACLCDSIEFLLRATFIEPFLYVLDGGYDSCRWDGILALFCGFQGFQAFPRASQAFRLVGCQVGRLGGFVYFLLQCLNVVFVGGEHRLQHVGGSDAFPSIMIRLEGLHRVVIGG